MSTQQPTPVQQDGLSMLNRLGVEDAEYGVPGSFNVTPGEYRVETFEMQRSTSPPIQALNAGPYPDSVLQTVTPLANDPACDVFPCEILEVLGIECCEEQVSWNDPDLVTSALPVRIPEATVYLNPFDASIEGDVALRVRNRSMQGERCTQEVCKCQDDGAVLCNGVDGSATVDGDDTHDITAAAADEQLDTVASSFSDVEPDNDVTREASFERTGAIDVIEAILELLITGVMQVDVQVDVTARTQWRGREYSEQFDIEATAWLPVDDVNYRW